MRCLLLGGYRPTESTSCAGFLVNLFLLEPSQFITKLSPLPSWNFLKAIFLPLGEKVGSSSFAELKVRRVWSAPSEFITFHHVDLIVAVSIAVEDDLAVLARERLDGGAGRAPLSTLAHLIFGRAPARAVPLVTVSAVAIARTSRTALIICLFTSLTIAQPPLSGASGTHQERRAGRSSGGRTVVT